MLGKFRLAGIVAAIGAAALLFVYVQLANEKSQHAQTKEAYAEYKIAAAEASISQAIELSADTYRVQQQLDAAIEEQAALQRRLRQTEIKRAADRRSADARIEELKRENEELAAWAATAIPGDWVDFMCEPAGCLAPADPEGDGR